MNRDTIIRGITRLPLFVALIALAGCAGSGTHIVSSHHPATDFSQYRSYTFAEPLSVDNNGVRTAIGMELVAATIRVLQERGMQLNNSSPDLRIDFFLSQSDMSSANTSLHSHSNMNAWSGYRMQAATARHMSSQIVNGTLVIDVTDIRRGTLVFEGLAESRITESMRDNLTETINTTVVDILAEMP